MRITVYGARGSCPSPSPANARYGGNTASVRVEADPAFPILFDLGTGVSQLAAAEPIVPPVRLTALVTHLHFDHVQGLPFFPPALAPDVQLDTYGPAQPSGSLHDAMAGLIRPPYFPVPVDELPAAISFHDVEADELSVGRATVKVRPVPHLGPTVGYRVECDGASVAYISDHQAPADLAAVADPVLELCEGVDLLIHDAQYTDAELSLKAHWGHCTFGYAVLVAATAGARRLCLFHHDPAHRDDELDQLLAEARALAAGRLEEVVSASEGLTLTV